MFSLETATNVDCYCSDEKCHNCTGDEALISLEESREEDRQRQWAVHASHNRLSGRPASSTWPLLHDCPCTPCADQPSRRASR